MSVRTYSSTCCALRARASSPLLRRGFVSSIYQSQYVSQMKS